jgi:hypothetical protein
MATKTVKVAFNTETGVLDIQTEGFQGKGCEAVHAAFAGGTPKNFVKKLEYNQVQVNNQYAR